MPGSSPGMTWVPQPSIFWPPLSGAGCAAQFRFQRGDARFQGLVLLARQPRHVLDRLEFLALDDVEVAQEFFGLVADHRVDLALDALRGAGGVVHQAPDLVEKPIAGLGHLKNLRSAVVATSRQWRSLRQGSRPMSAASGKLPCHVPVSLQSYRLPKQETASEKRP